MKDEIFIKLGDRLNENMFKLPPVKPVIAFLKEIYTEEEAAMCAEFPIGAHTLEVLAQHYRREPKALEQMLENMADKFMIFVSCHEASQKEYSLIPYAPGLIEAEFMKGEDTPRARKMARLFKEIFSTIGEATKEAMENPEMVEEIPPPTLRTMTVEKALAAESTVFSYEKLSEVLNDETSFAATACPCRMKAKLTDHPCSIEGVPQDTCVYFGKAADYMVERKYARRLTRNELDELLRICNEKGLVHNLNNHLGPNLVLCNCCGCCCSVFGLYKQMPEANMISVSNFVCTVDENTCIGCEDCAGRCQVEAIVVENERVRINQKICIGCGNCVAACPSGALAMVRRKKEKPGARPPEIVGLGV